MTRHGTLLLAALTFGALAAAGCSSSSTAATPAGAGGSAGSGSGLGDAQTPPMGGASVEMWLKGGAYKAWHSEAAVHDARSPSPHGFNRIYSNDAIHNNAAAATPWPVGASAVKELYASATDAAPVGYAVYLKTNADSAGGANWYWYERVPLTSMAPHDATTGVVADGMGDSGTAKSICVGCHTGAGSNPEHTPSPGGRDQVYTPVL